MRLKPSLLVICIETTIIVLFLFLTFLHSVGYFEGSLEQVKEYTIIVNDPSIPMSNSVLIYNDNLYSVISLTEKGELNSVSVIDKYGRIVSVHYSEIGIVSFVISDDKTNYKIEKLFPENFSSDMLIGQDDNISEYDRSVKK